MDSSVLFHAVSGSLRLSLKLILIIVPLMVIYEFLENSRIFKQLLDFLYLFIKPFGFSKKASVSMFTGIILGITYGSGILIAQSEKKELRNMDILLTATFLSMCHAVIEDTLVFVAIGGNGLYMLVVRLIIASFITYVFYKYLRKRFI